MDHYVTALPLKLGAQLLKSLNHQLGISGNQWCYQFCRGVSNRREEQLSIREGFGSRKHHRGAKLPAFGRWPEWVIAHCTTGYKPVWIEFTGNFGIHTISYPNLNTLTSNE